MTNLRVKKVLRYDPGFPKVRLLRVMWERGTVGDGTGFSAKLAVALRPRLALLKRERDGFRLCVLGLEVHYQRSWGGIFA